ncbi:MAG: 4-hydroxythreonine-4-phosphate dehydrogenase PdxA [Cycloclasticus sp.]|nr:MAG: 4-hydroxythreonine-4-phosphate dehydrogenase PdxA [Cycloclasticus sp.]
MPIPRIIITPGEPAGIGPDVCLLVAQKPWPCEIVFIADPQLLSRRAKLLGLSIDTHILNLNESPCEHKVGLINIIPTPLAKSETCAQLDASNAPYVLETLKKAAQLCLEKKCQAIVTGPVQKSILNKANIAFSGHTEYFAEMSESYPVMMLATKKLRVALATTHIALKDVSHTISKPLLNKTINILHSELISKFNISDPRIAVCGLNPHAGESGYLGDEEINIISPVLENFRAQGLKITGPMPADTVFTQPVLEQHDAVLAMYHDQGLPTLKYSGFGEAVNITLGLPFIRTSVDHGTALHLAGTGEASSTSLESALDLAIQLTAH